MHYEPIINCGLYAGDHPSYWSGEKFQTEEECDAFIEEHDFDWINSFDLEEDDIEDRAYPMEFED